MPPMTITTLSMLRNLCSRLSLHISHKQDIAVVSRHCSDSQVAHRLSQCVIDGWPILTPLVCQWSRGSSFIFMLAALGCGPSRRCRVCNRRRQGSCSVSSVLREKTVCRSRRDFSGQRIAAGTSFLQHALQQVISLAAAVGSESATLSLREKKKKKSSVRKFLPQRLLLTANSNVLRLLETLRNTVNNSMRYPHGY